MRNREGGSMWWNLTFKNLNKGMWVKTLSNGERLVTENNCVMSHPGSAVA